MKIALKSSGGFANLRIEGQVDTAELNEDLAQRVETHLHPKKLKKTEEEEARPKTLSASPFGMAPGGADARQYELTVLPEDDGEDAESFTLDDGYSEAAVLEVIDDLMHELVQRKAAAVASEKVDEEE